MIMVKNPIQLSSLLPATGLQLTAAATWLSWSWLTGSTYVASALLPWIPMPRGPALWTSHTGARTMVGLLSGSSLILGVFGRPLVLVGVLWLALGVANPLLGPSICRIGPACSEEP